MKVITPTPSQAAVVLRKFLQQNGTELQLSVTQEAVARMRGYADWQALVTEINPRTGKPYQQESRRPQVATQLPVVGATKSLQRLCILLLHGHITFADMAGASVWRYVEVLKPWAQSHARLHKLLPMKDVALQYMLKNGEKRNVSILELAQAQDDCDNYWRLLDGTTFHVKQASIESVIRYEDSYMAPVNVSFSTGTHYSGYAEYFPETGEVTLAEDVLDAMSADFNDVVMSIELEVAGQRKLAYTSPDGGLVLEGLDELPFGTRMGQVSVAKPAFVSYGSEPKTPVLSWNEVLRQGVSKKAHRADVRTTASFGGSQCMYLGRGEWQYDADESFRLYDETGNLWIPSRKNFVKKVS